MGGKYLDITGQTWNCLTAIRHVGTKVFSHQRKASIWLFRCDCGKEFESVARPVKRGERKSCGCLTRRGWESIAWHIFRKAYNDGNLTFTQFIEMSQLPCFYCGIGPSNVRTKRGVTWIYNGLNRIDHINGVHDLDNLVPCCWNHNNMIRNKHHDDFLDEVAVIYNKCCLNRPSPERSCHA